LYGDIPAKEQRTNNGFAQQGSERRLSQRSDAGAKHEKSKNDHSGIQQIYLHGEVAYDQIYAAPDNAEDSGRANGPAGAKSEERFVLLRVKNGIVTHQDH
jgi:hypothetical protein